MAGGKLISTGVEFPDATTQTTSGLPLTGGTMTGTIAGFTSTGIDDNATSTAITIASTGGVTIAPSTTPVALNLTPNNSNCDITFASTNTSSATRLRTSINDFQIHTNGVQKVSVGSGGDVTVNTGNLVIGTSGKGIDFSATSDGSGTMTSEVLDDYETGTWSATFTAAVTAPTTAQVETGLYTKVGNTLTARVYSNSFSMVGSSGILKVTGLPFSSSAATTHKAIGAITVHSLNLATGCSGLSSVVHAGATEIYFYEAKDGAAYGSITDNTATSARLWITITYQV